MNTFGIYKGKYSNLPESCCLEFHIILGKNCHKKTTFQLRNFHPTIIFICDHSESRTCLNEENHQINNSRVSPSTFLVRMSCRILQYGFNVASGRHQVNAAQHVHRCTHFLSTFEQPPFAIQTVTTALLPASLYCRCWHRETTSLVSTVSLNAYVSFHTNHIKNQ